MPSIKKKKVTRPRASVSKVRSRSKGVAASEVPELKSPQLNRSYLEELLKEGKLLASLQQKELSGKELSLQESRVLAALRLKCETIERNTRALEEASGALKSALMLRKEVRTICAAQPATHTTTAKRAETNILHLVERDYRTALRHAKNKLLALLEQDWVVHTLLAIGTAGTIGWLGHRAAVSAADATTELLREANQMTHAIEATRELIQTTSHEGAKWTFSALGGAVGAANGLLLSALLPGLAGKASVSALTSATMGMYAGWRSLS